MIVSIKMIPQSSQKSTRYYGKFEKHRFIFQLTEMSDNGFQQEAGNLAVSIVQDLELKWKNSTTPLDFITLTKTAMEVVEQLKEGKLSGAEKHQLVLLVLREFINRMDIPEETKNEMREMIEQSADSLISCLICVSKGMTKINRCCKKNCKNKCEKWFGCILGMLD